MRRQAEPGPLSRIDYLLAEYGLSDPRTALAEAEPTRLSLKPYHASIAAALNTAPAARERPGAS